jgi:hypothetical protein
VASDPVLRAHRDPPGDARVSVCRVRTVTDRQTSGVPLAIASRGAGRIMARGATYPRAYRDVCLWSVRAYPVLRMVQAHPRAACDFKTRVR